MSKTDESEQPTSTSPIAIAQVGSHEEIGQNRYKGNDPVRTKTLMPFQLPFHRLADVLLWVDATGRIVAANPKAREIVGDSDRDPIGQSIEGVVADWNQATWKHLWKTALSRKEVCLEARLRDRQDRSIPVTLRLDSIDVEDRTYCCLSASITYRSASDDGNGDRFRHLADNGRDAIYCYSLVPEARFEYVSPSIETITGYAPGDYYTDPELPLKRVHPDDRDILRHLLRSPCASEAPVVLRWFHKNGRVVWTEQRDVRVYDRQGNCIAIEGILRDITERRQSELALRQQAERERLVSAIAQRIRQSLNLEDILQTTVTEVRQFLQSDRVLIYRFDEDPAEDPDCPGVVAVESVDAPWPPMLDTSIPVDSAAEELKYYLTGRIRTFDNVRTDVELGLHPLLERFQVKSSLVVPILLQSSESLETNRLWGLLVAHQCREQRHWQAIEIELLEQLATQVAIALQQSHLFEQVQRQGVELEGQIRERTQQLQQALEFEAMLKRITDKVRDSLDESQIVETAVREVAVGLGVKSCNAALYDLERGTSTICYESAPLIPTSQGRVSRMGNFPEIYTQLLTGEYFQFCSLIHNPKRGRVAMLACPMFDNQGVLGDLWLVHHPDYIFSDQEIRLVQQVANQCAIAIRQARLYQASQAQVAELEKLNRLKDDFLSAVSHELRTPIANMKLAIEMLKIFAPGREPTAAPELLDGEQIGRIQRYLNILSTECTREEELVEDLLDLQRLENNAYVISMSLIDLNEWIPSILQPFYTRIAKRQQSLKVDRPEKFSPFVGDRINLERILVELLNNACKYTPNQGEIHLKVRESEKTDPDRGQTIPTLEFAVSNQADIPPEELPKIFDKFYRIPNADPWKQGGTGLGLALVEKLVTQLEGEIHVESQNGWTTFSLVFLNQRHKLNNEN
ncbi:GAF domain-containing protein [Baaleninema sp.]|uniref:GAF domain-containing protein n=1 Tax=Baaleninema sp. TaxID=3101197 RepID=UPI003D077275